MGKLRDGSTTAIILIREHRDASATALLAVTECRVTGVSDCHILLVESGNLILYTSQYRHFPGHPDHDGDNASTSDGSPTIPCPTPRHDNPVDSETGAGSRPKEKIQGQNWAEDFKARSRVETSRNCVGVDKGITAMIVAKVFEQLLADDAAEVKALPDGRSWNAGGEFDMSQNLPFPRNCQFMSPTIIYLAKHHFL